MLEGVASPLSCCRACRAKGAGIANVWNYCASPGGCTYALDGDSDRTVSMTPGQCDLRYNLATTMAMGERRDGPACLPATRCMRIMALTAVRA